MTAAIEVENLTKDFRLGFLMRKKRILDDLSFRVDRGVIFAFLGPNGAGKTTTIKLLLDLLHPTAGRIRILGEDNRSLAVRGRIGYLPDNPYFYDYLTPAEILDYVGRLYSLSAAVRREHGERLLDLVRMSAHRDLPMRKCSKGMIQRVGLAQAMMGDPELVILDEPMGGLDPIGRKEVRDIMLGLKEQGKTVFFSTHILSDAEMISDQAAIVVEGRIRNIGSIEKLTGTEARGYELSFEPAENCPLLERRDSFERLVERDGIVYLHLAGREGLDDVLRELSAGAGRLLTLSPQKPSMEEAFLTSTQDARRSF